MQRQYHWRAARLLERIPLICISLLFNSMREPADRTYDRSAACAEPLAYRVRAANTTGGATPRRPTQNTSTAGSALRVARQEQTHGGARPDHRAARTAPARI